MEKIKTETLEKTPKEDWRDYYLENGEEMIALARSLLESDNPSDIDLGLSIIEEAYFEEDEENPDTPPSLHELDFGVLVPTLNKLKDNKKYSKRAERCLEIISLEKGEKDVVDPHLFLKDLESSGDTKPRKAIGALLEALDEGKDISSALPIIFKREEKLAMATDAMQLVATYYLRHKEYGELEALLNRDEAGAVRIYRGITAALDNGEDATDFISRPGVLDLLKKVSVNGRVMPIEDFL
jgi:hypothetical protein